MHLYQLNCQLEEELNSLQRDSKNREKQTLYEEEELQAELSTLRQVYDNKKLENKRLKKEE